MHASAGDEIVIEAHHLGQPRRTGEILEVRGPDGTPPYLVQWDDSPHAVLFFPGSDARVEHPHPRHHRDDAVVRTQLREGLGSSAVGRRPTGRA